MSREVGVFVNINNQYFTTQTIYKGRKIDYAKYLELAIGPNEQLFRAIAYGVQMEREACGFISCLNHLGFETNYRTARIVDGKPSIRHTDRNMEIAMDIVRCLDSLDTVIIGSNDLNLIPLLQFIRERGKRVIVFSSCISKELRLAATQAIDIKENVLEEKVEEEVVE